MRTLTNERSGLKSDSLVGGPGWEAIVAYCNRAVVENSRGTGFVVVRSERKSGGVAGLSTDEWEKMQKDSLEPALTTEHLRARVSLGDHLGITLGEGFWTRFGYRVENLLAANDELLQRWVMATSIFSPPWLGMK